MKIVRTLGGFPCEDPQMPLNTVKFFAGSDYFGYWLITDRRKCGLHPEEDCVLWTLTRGPWLQFRTLLRSIFT